jgi:hypothetical protein
VDILHLIDRLEEIVSEGRRVPVGGGVVVSRQRIIDLIERMRVAVPREVYEARDVIEQREAAIDEGRRQAQDLLSRAHDELENRLNETEVVKAAHERSRQLTLDAERRVRDLLQAAEEQARQRLDESQAQSRQEMKEADVYALQTLRKLEEQLEGFLTTVRNGVDALEQRAADRPRS